jgi:hypothetical protein
MYLKPDGLDAQIFPKMRFGSNPGNWEGLPRTMTRTDASKGVKGAGSRGFCLSLGPIGKIAIIIAWR